MKEFGLKVGLDKADAFEGWFCKIDDLKNDLMLSVIWGYSTNQKTKHAFIQFQDTISKGTNYISYPLDKMKWTKDPFVLQIGKNELTETGMYLDLMLDGKPIRGDFSFTNTTPIKKSIFKPNIMGILSYFPNQCNHAIISMNHRVTGNIQMGDQLVGVRDAYGYMEKDWGTGFPKEYVWIQANNWEDSSVVFSYATVPILGKYAKGFFLVLHHNGKEYRFSSIEGSKLLEFHVSKDSFSTVIEKKGLRLTLSARQTNPIDLVSPEGGAMNSYIKESLEGSLKLTLEAKNQSEISLTSQRASIDVHFDEVESN